MRRGAGFDPAVSMNACALVVVEEIAPQLWRPIRAKLWQGSASMPLDIRLNVGPEAAEIVRGLGLTSWMSDMFAWAEVRLVSREFALQPILDSGPLEQSFGPVRRMLNRGLLGQPGARLSLRSEDPDMDELCARMAMELGGVTSKRKGDTLSIIMPHGEEGAHGDLGRALVRALWHARADVAAPAMLDDDPRRFLHARAEQTAAGDDGSFRSSRAR